MFQRNRWPATSGWAEDGDNIFLCNIYNPFAVYKGYGIISQ